MSQLVHPRPVAAEVLGPRVLEALGLPPMGVLGFSLHFEVGEVVRARVEFAVDREAQLEPLLREFVLVARDSVDTGATPLPGGRLRGEG